MKIWIYFNVEGYNYYNKIWVHDNLNDILKKCIMPQKIYVHAVLIIIILNISYTEK